MKHIIILCGAVAALSSLPGFVCGDEAKTAGVPMREGTVIAPDTEDNWWQFTHVVGGYIRDESNGVHPPGGLASWNDLWLDVIRAHRESQQNSERYVRYIIDERREAGLPDLPGYDSTESGQQ